jgi:hypothetical protein
MYTCTESTPRLITQEVEYAKVFDFQVEIKGKREDLQACINYTKFGEFDKKRLRSIHLGDTYELIEDETQEQISDWIVEVLWSWCDQFSDNTEDYNEDLYGIHDKIVEYLKKEKL